MPRTTDCVTRRVLIAATAISGFAAVTPGSALGQNAISKAEVTIRPGGQLVNLISIFSVDNLNQRALLKALQDGTETFFSQMPGFVSSTVLVSKDGKRVINYSQWRTVDDIAAFRRDSRFLPYLQQLRALASIESGEFDAVHSQGV
jgi:heme-degrading monooxygenase HmoA